ncbi:MAG: DegT/DnrJ/EryC1/StrS family aminotransferase [Pseudonocardiaceae bacterium]
MHAASPLRAEATAQPARRTVPLSSPDLTATERRYVLAALESGWVSGTGPYITDFEQRFAQKCDRQHALAVANGTLALETVLRALGIGPGDEVILPALTFAAPASSVLAVGASVVLVDISPETWTIDPQRLSEVITPKSRAIIAVDVLGHPADYDALGGFGLPIIEDAAEAHGARYKGRPCGSFGAASIFSFHANKPITTGEGGCVTTDSPDLAGAMRLLANHGMSAERPYVHDVVGRNFRMTNLVAAVGLGQLDRWDELLAARERVCARYDQLLDGSAYTGRPVAEWADYSPWLHTIAVENRAQVLAYVRERGVDARAIWPTLGSQPLFGPVRHFPVAEEVAAGALWLPTSSAMSDEDVSYVSSTVNEALAHAGGSR